MIDKVLDPRPTGPKRVQIQKGASARLVRINQTNFARTFAVAIHRDVFLQRKIKIKNYQGARMSGRVCKNLLFLNKKSNQMGIP